MKKFDVLKCVICLLLVCCVLFNISPIRAQAVFAPVYIGVAAATVIGSVLIGLGILPNTNPAAFNDLVTSLIPDLELDGLVEDGLIYVLAKEAVEGNLYYVSQQLVHQMRQRVFEKGVLVSTPSVTLGNSFSFTINDVQYLVTSDYDIGVVHLYADRSELVSSVYSGKCGLVLVVSPVANTPFKIDGRSSTYATSSYSGLFYYDVLNSSGGSYLQCSINSFYLGDVLNSDGWKSAWQYANLFDPSLYANADLILEDVATQEEELEVGYEDWYFGVTFEEDPNGGDKKHPYWPVKIPNQYEDVLDYTQDEVQSGVGSTYEPDLSDPDLDFSDMDTTFPDTVSGTFLERLGATLKKLLTNYIVNPIKEFWSNTVASLDLPTFWNNLTTAFKTHIADPITSIWDNTVASIQAGTFWETLGETILSPLQWLADHLLSGISSLFFPSQDFLTVKVEALLERFSFLRSIVDSGKAIGESLSGIDTEPPIIYAELDKSTGKYDYGERAVVLDMRWYADYKPTVDAILSAVFWALFCWRMFIHAPNIISGVASNVGHVVTSYQRDINRRQK